MKEMKTGILSKIRRAVSKNNALVYPLSVKHDNLEFYRKLKIVRRQIRNADKDSKKALKGNTLALELCQKKIDELGKKCSDIIPTILKFTYLALSHTSTSSLLVN